MQLRADLTFAQATGMFDILLVTGGPSLSDAPLDPSLIE